MGTCPSWLRPTSARHIATVDRSVPSPCQVLPRIGSPRASSCSVSETRGRCRSEPRLRQIDLLRSGRPRVVHSQRPARLNRRGALMRCPRTRSNQSRSLWKFYSVIGWIRKLLILCALGAGSPVWTTFGTGSSIASRNRRFRSHAKIRTRKSSEEGAGLLRPQGHDRIDARGAASRNERGRECHHNQEERDDGERQRVPRPHLVQQTSQDARH
jgi:hypothetical protein